ncbi:hypothetical protein BKA69DRAFT_1165785 [Paraphysoderma sedebokerense]|nr:hypothetical protein BKA69DRAFT_1165785 [Paraphysoderma sedebokerense]
MFATINTSIYVILSLLLSSLNAQQIECPKIQPATDVSASYNLNTAFYQKYLPGPGAMKNIPIVASSKVTDEAMYRAWYVLQKMGETLDPAAWDAIASKHIRLGIMARTEQTLDIPEHSDLQQAFPDTDWNSRARGLGATEVRPATTFGEENVLSLPRGELPNDRYAGECILVHEFSHTIHQFGMQINATFDAALKSIFDHSMAQGRWSQTYATTNMAEYWAEAVQSYFDCNQFSATPDGIHNDINTREKLQTYDPEIYALINDVFKDNPWRYQLPAAETSICNPSSAPSDPTVQRPGSYRRRRRTRI